jgi:hypothetical protein
LPGLGTVLVAKVLGHIGDISRFPTEHHFASYTGSAPLDASSGKNVRHRLNTGGNRALKSALHIIARSACRSPVAADRARWLTGRRDSRRASRTAIPSSRAAPGSGGVSSSRSKCPAGWECGVCSASETARVLAQRRGRPRQQVMRRCRPADHAFQVQCQVSDPPEGCALTRGSRRNLRLLPGSGSGT